MPYPIRIVLVLLALVLNGCGQDTAGTNPAPAEVPQPGPAIEDPGPAPEGQTEPPMAEEPVPAAGESGDDSVSLKLQTWEATEQLIASYKGKVVVVDFWSTSCLPCRREFPHLVALQQTHPEEVACVSVSLDYTGRKSRPPESYQEPVLKFLQEQQATFDNILSTDDPDELEQRLELAAIPLVWVYNQSGERVQSFDNGDLEGKEFTYEADVVPFVQSLLKKPAT